jgi:dTDP-4-amino-4,6-dideoxygalactose transaminase
MRIGRTLPPAASPIYFRDIISGLKGLIRRHRELNRFEAELKQYFGVRHCFLVSSGKAALTLILQALRNIHPDRDEVLIPAFTCYSVPSAIARAGLKVRLCDIDPNTLDFNFDRLSKILKQYSAKPPSKPSRANNPYPLPQAQRSSSLPREMPSIFHRGEALLQPDASSSRLLAIIPVHLFGLPADIARLRKILK